MRRITTLSLAIFLAAFSVVIAGQSDTVLVVDQAVGNATTYVINSSLEYVVQITDLKHKIETRPPRVNVICKECELATPVLVVVRQQKGVLSWSLPYDSADDDSGNTTLHRDTSRTLCPFDIVNQTATGNTSGTYFLSVSLSTHSTKNVSVSLLIRPVKHFVIQMNKNLSLHLHPSAPEFYLFQFPENVTSVLLSADAADDSCMTVSVQDVECPVHDMARDVRFHGYWQSVTRLSGFTVTKSKFPRGFYVVFVVRDNDDSCVDEKLLMVRGDPVKDVNVTVKPTISQKQYLFGTLLAVGVLTGFCIAIGTSVMFYMNRILYPSLDNMAEPRPAIAAIRNRVRNGASAPAGDDRVDISSVHSQDGAPDGVPYSYVRRGNDSDSTVACIPEAEYINPNISRDDVSINSADDSLAQIINDESGPTHRCEGVYVCHLSRKHPNYLARKAQRHLWYLTTVAIFYFLPVVQLVITYQEVLHSTGNQNLCYYNFLCAHPLGLLIDFNHVFSNIGYVVLGLLFLLLVKWRHNIHLKAARLNMAIDRCFGIPQHFGLFYAMGAALIVEGIMSACYHVCPNHLNFQFDTSFMYVQAALCMMKIYHSRHPDKAAGAYAVFAVLAVTILFGMCGILDGTPAFWSIFTLVHLFTCFAFSLRIYYLGTWKLADLNVKRMAKNFAARFRQNKMAAVRPALPSRFIIIGLANLINWAMAILGPQYKIDDFGGYLLMIFMVNLMIYCTFYIIMKLVCKETIGAIPLIFIILSIVSWSCSLYYFKNGSTSWRLTPAKSRENNRPCQLAEFYDNHDIWHFLSALSMFFSFMVLLTLDDDLINTPRDKIFVF